MLPKSDKIQTCGSLSSSSNMAWLRESRTETTFPVLKFRGTEVFKPFCARDCLRSLCTNIAVFNF